MLTGIIGAPNKGKSTLFNALTHGNAAVADYPFTTIDPNKGVAFVEFPCPCRELGTKCNPRNSECVNGTRRIPVNVVDAAGLVPGAHEGRGRGIEFLNDLASADALICVVDASGRTNEEGNPAQEGYDVVNDFSFIEGELDHWLAGVVKRNAQRAKSIADIEKLLSGVGAGGVVRKAISSSGVGETVAAWHEPQYLALAKELRKLSKPMVIAANKIDSSSAKQNIEKLRASVSIPVIPTAADAELALQRASAKGLVEYDGKTMRVIAQGLPPQATAALEKINRIIADWGSTGVTQVLNTVVFDLLGAVVAFPVEDEKHFADHKGAVLPDAVLLPPGATAVDLARKIHSDLADSFLYAVNARTKMRMGKDEKLKQGDVVRVVAAK